MQHFVCSTWLRLIRQWLFLVSLGDKESWLRAVFIDTKEAAPRKVFEEQSTQEMSCWQCTQCRETVNGTLEPTS